ncbi:unnamed protein product [Moneuplotes crassus]|uniref:Cyclic nucleotide-binding domain-containing protein n=2 Tax=Euplotes crassus TaxID=5936 RepID=A0AAD1UHP8_EUPCR|nr:unnamed protein product [Moneuplotes crassus]
MKMRDKYLLNGEKLEGVDFNDNPPDLVKNMRKLSSKHVSKQSEGSSNNPSQTQFIGNSGSHKLVYHDPIDEDDPFNTHKENDLQLNETYELSTDPDPTTVIVSKGRKWLCRFQESRRIYWDLFIMALAIFNCIQVPYTIAFLEDEDDSVGVYILNQIIDSIFIADLVISFRTTYINEETGIEVNDPKHIAINYIKGRFWLDLLASIPTDLISLIIPGSDNATFILNMFNLLKLMRVARLSRLIAYLNLKSDIKMAIRLIKLVFFLILYLHCVSCLWFYIVRQDNVWIPPLDENYSNPLIYERHHFYQYLTSFYYSVLMLAGNDMAPQGTAQLILSTIFILAASIINANIFGNMAVILQQMNRRNSAFHEKVEIATSTMRNMSIPEHLQNRVQAYLISTQATLDQQKEFDDFLQLLSPSLKSEVTKHIFQECIIGNPIFEEKVEIIEIVLYDLTTLLFLPEDEICRQGSAGSKFYFLAKGDCQVFIKDENQNARQIHTLVPGSYFGEVALLKECYRTATVKSKNYTTCASLDQKTFAKLIAGYPFLKTAMEKRIKENYQDRWRKFVKMSLRNIDFLSNGVSDEVIEEISYKMEMISLHANEHLFHSGYPCREIFIICNGELEIMISSKSIATGRYLETLSSGCNIGSYSCLVYEDYTITGIAQTDVSVIKLDFAILDIMRNKYDDLDRKMNEYEKFIDENGLPNCDFKLYRSKQNNPKPIVKFREAVNRLIRILKSYKNVFTDILRKIQEKIREEKREKEKRQLKKTLHSKPQTHEQKVEQMLTILSTQMNELREEVSDLREQASHCICGAQAKEGSSKRSETATGKRESLQIVDDLAISSRVNKRSSRFSQANAVQEKEQPLLRRMFDAQMNLRRKTTTRQGLDLQNLGSGKYEKVDLSSNKNTQPQKLDGSQTDKNILAESILPDEVYKPPNHLLKTQNDQGLPQIVESKPPNEEKKDESFFGKSKDSSKHGHDTWKNNSFIKLHNYYFEEDESKTYSVRIVITNINQRKPPYIDSMTYKKVLKAFLQCEKRSK